MGLIWKLIVGGLWKTIAFVLGALGIYLKARSDTNDKRDKLELERKLEAKETRDEIEDAIDAKTDAAVRGDLGRWVRPE